MHKHLVPLAAAALLSFALPSAQAQSPDPGMALAGTRPGSQLIYLPKPSLAPGELPRPKCDPRTTRHSNPPATPEVIAELYDLSRGAVAGILSDWMKLHLGYEHGQCIEWPFAIAKFQQALGNKVTGTLEFEDVARLRKAWSDEREARARKLDGRADLADDRPRTLLDFLPKVGNAFGRQCDELQGQADMDSRNRLNQWGARNPPGPGRAAAWEQAQQAERDRLNTVAPAWAEFWESQPALAAWARANRCERIRLRFRIEAWQLASGMQADANNPQGIERSRELIAQANAKLAEFSGNQERKMQADAEQSGDAALARNWSLDELGGRTKLAEVKSLLPNAICQVSGDKLACRKPRVCDAEQTTLMAARSKAQSLLPAERVNGRENVQQAEDALRICSNRYRYTAAARSEILFAGQKLRDAELQFDSQGLVSMKLTVQEDSDAVRNALTRRYGIPETQQQTRVRTETRFGGGGTAYTDTGRMVTVNPSAQQVEVPYSVTRYVWKTPKVLVEEVTGAVQFRFAGN